MCVQGAVQRSGFPFGVYSHLGPSVPGIHGNREQDKVATVNE